MCATRWVGCCPASHQLLASCSSAACWAFTLGVSHSCLMVYVACPAVCVVDWLPTSCSPAAHQLHGLTLASGFICVDVYLQHPTSVAAVLLEQMPQMSKDGHAMLRERVVFTFQKGKQSRIEQPSAQICEAVTQLLAGHGSPFTVTLQVRRRLIGRTVHRVVAIKHKCPACMCLSVLLLSMHPAMNSLRIDAFSNEQPPGPCSMLCAALIMLQPALPCLTHAGHKHAPGG